MADEIEEKRFSHKEKVFYAGVFYNLKPFNTKSEAMKYAEDLDKDTDDEVRVICPNGKNILLTKIKK